MFLSSKQDVRLPHSAAARLKVVVGVAGLALAWSGATAGATAQPFPVDACVQRVMSAHPYPRATGGPPGRRLTPSEIRAVAHYEQLESAAWTKCAPLATASREPSVSDPRVFVEMSAHDSMILNLALAASYLNEAGAHLFAAGDRAEGRALMARALQRMLALGNMPMSDNTRHRHLDGYIADAKRLAANPEQSAPTMP